MVLYLKYINVWREAWRFVANVYRLVPPYGPSKPAISNRAFNIILSGTRVKDRMVEVAITLRTSTTPDEAVNDYFLRYGHGEFPATDGTRVLGILPLKAIKESPGKNGLGERIRCRRAL